MIVGQYSSSGFVARHWHYRLNSPPGVDMEGKLGKVDDL